MGTLPTVTVKLAPMPQRKCVSQRHTHHQPMAGGDKESFRGAGLHCTVDLHCILWGGSRGPLLHGKKGHWTSWGPALQPSIPRTLEPIDWSPRSPPPPSAPSLLARAAPTPEPLNHGGSHRREVPSNKIARKDMPVHPTSQTATALLPFIPLSYLVC